MMLRRRPHRFRPSRIKGLSFNRLIPNIFTVLALCAGLTAIRFGLQERWQAAVALVVIAAILDGLDGRLARLLGGTSKFGAELDSLSDFLSFGVTPAILIYLWTFQGFSGFVGFGWATVLFFSTCCALRLARFNTKIGEEMPAWAYNYFTGVPAPAGAGLALLPMIVSFEVGSGLFSQPILNAIWLVLVGLLFISRIPTFAFKRVKVPHHYVLPTLVGVGVLTAALASAPWVTLSLAGAAYIASIPFSMRSFQHLQREAARVEAAAGMPVEPAEPPPTLPRP
ncbi:MAG: CDP-diacylglycerol--serine O-phosphatidyltransferase [Proteobacteria bacterium]|nr:CDP-diacylglycerol--serine O-phosphatidyltransferase [Pseudomonadota bacterium]MBI3498136.1 CDP-diacylglycerol--serine O-phosphatidyltransferase [Pseudomonadota bacterium]